MTASEPSVYRLRTLPKDLGVALVVAVALGLGWLLMAQTEGRTRAYAEPGGGISLAYPATWIGVDSLQDLLLKVEDPQTAAAFKTTLSVERRDLDPADPPTLQTLLDRRVEERGQIAGYHLLSDGEAILAGQRAILLEYAYVVQPIDTPRRASLPVVVHAREYLVITSDRSYYIALAAPEESFGSASAAFERIVRSIALP
ncbi:hypothetical protein K2Z83_12435 [Oscillochloris sp. ZM17-4]|uniref:hypothetical protein n=1 Tax=Oscillochloris sp. ZM17-4 TaxID=2866714 RepID=UPI001C72E31F|nr:hypothetical protein [Oscillochloris sp. ZM17-4]MBX0328485.1 hypothetical protein [Oscillochloris sp. ZM17-4]